MAFNIIGYYWKHEKMKEEMLSRLEKVYSELNSKNPIKFKDIAALGFGSNTVYSILHYLEREGIAKREGKEYIIDWNKLKEYISKEAI
jgi:Mn-dependent DtxR family transcriptional regulator